MYVLKISEFARKYGVEISTVRYYINSHLLLPKVQNKQYRFDERCETDMNIIVQLKDFGFSINEIRTILSLIHLSNLTAMDDVTDFVQILEKKETELRTQLESMQATHRELLGFISSLKNKRIREDFSSHTKGVPLSMLPLLCCPDCGTPLELQKADIIGGEVMNGEACCSCGYHASIQNGIVLTEEGTLNSLDIPYLNRGIFKLLPVSWVSLFQQSFNKMYDKMCTLDTGGKIILENQLNCFSFLFSRVSELDPSNYYILTDPHPEIVLRFKKMIEQQNTNLNILYIVDKTCRYPLKKGCVDIFTDICSINDFGAFHGDEDLFSAIRPYLKPQAEMIGTYLYCRPNSPTYKNLLANHPDCAQANYQLSYFHSLINKCGAELLTEGDVGSVDEWCGENPCFFFHIDKDPVFFHMYHCRMNG